MCLKEKTDQLIPVFLKIKNYQKQQKNEKHAIELYKVNKEMLCN